jgi:hypothetical protein
VTVVSVLFGADAVFTAILATVFTAILATVFTAILATVFTAILATVFATVLGAIFASLSIFRAHRAFAGFAGFPVFGTTVVVVRQFRHSCWLGSRCSVVKAMMISKG